MKIIIISFRSLNFFFVSLNEQNKKKELALFRQKKKERKNPKERKLKKVFETHIHKIWQQNKVKFHILVF